MPSYTLHYFNHRGRAEICRMLFAAAGVQYNDRRFEMSEWNNLRGRMPCSMLPVLDIDGRTQIPHSMAIARYLAREFGFHGKTNMEIAKVDYISDCFYDIMDDYMRMYHDKDGRMLFDRMCDMRQRYCDMDGRMCSDRRFDMRSDVHSEMRSELRPEMRSDMRSDMYPDLRSDMYSDMHSGDSFNNSRMMEMRMRYQETCHRVLPFLERTLDMHSSGNQFFMGDQMMLCDMMCYTALENPMQENPNLLRNYPKLRALRERVYSTPQICSYMKRRNYSDF